MPDERQEPLTELSAVVDAPLETGPLPLAPDEPLPDETQLMLGMHLSIAARLLREGSASRAFAELVRAAREAPLSARLAASLTRVALLAGTTSAAVTLISDAVTDAEEAERPGILRALARLHRRGEDLERAREQLVVLLAERPFDRRARFVLNALLEREERWDELDASLERETREHHRQGKLRSASRAALRRARLWAERLNDPSRAALRYGQAAQYAAQAEDLESAFLLRLLWLRALHQSRAPKNVVEEAIDLALDAGDAVGKADRVEALATELGLLPAKPAAAPAAPTVRRHSTQIELMAVADAVKTQARPEVAAILVAAVQEAADPQAIQRLEAHYVARGAWRDLADLYRRSANRAATAQDKLEELEKLAEVLESELHDAVGAAKVYGDMVALGDGRAVAEQVRLLNLQKDASGVKAALDESVQRTTDPKLKADALVMRADDALVRRAVDAARADYQEALRLQPSHAPAAAGLAELTASSSHREPVQVLHAALLAMPRRKHGRGELFRRLARLADAPLEDEQLGREAWTEVLGELPDDDEALGRLMELCRRAHDDVQLETVLKAQLRREPRGTRARRAHLELVALLERRNRHDEALEALKAAVRFEPGNKEAWLALADRFLHAGQTEEAVWALEHGATATESGDERVLLWLRLGRLARERLRDHSKADAYDLRAEKLRRELLAESQQAPLGGKWVAPPLKPRVAAPRRENPFDAVAAALGARSEPDPPRPPRALPNWGPLSPAPVLRRAEPAAAGVEEAPGPDGAADEVELAEALSGEDDVVEVGTSDIEPPSAEWEAPVGELELLTPPPQASPPRKTAELPVALGDSDLPVPPSVISSPSHALSAERRAIFEQVRENPLEPDGYKMLAEHFDHTGDPGRSSLMLEIARALEGDPNAAPRAPRLILSATDRAGLKHPLLRGEAGELLGMTGLALCRLYPARSLPREELRLDSGKGAQKAADALLCAVRTLGLRAPDVFLAEENGPPFSLIHTTEPTLLVGKLAVRKALPDAELRFFAGRALFTQNPDLLALRSLRKDQLAHGLQVLGQALAGRGVNVEARVVRDAIPQRSFTRVKELYEKNLRKLDLPKLQEGARHSANRAGLVVCGGVAPALAALRAKKALDSEVLELVRFAASERYLALKGRKLGV